MESIPVPEKIYGVIVEIASDFRKKVNDEYLDVSAWNGPMAVKRRGMDDAAERVAVSGLLDRLLNDSFRIETEEEKEDRLNPNGDIEVK